MSAPDRLVYLRPLPDDGTEASLRFRLVYDGELRPSGNDAGLNAGLRVASHKHDIRKVFHRQLKQLWVEHRTLAERDGYPSDYGLAPDAVATHENGRAKYRDILAAMYPRLGYRFVPLVREKLSIQCDLDVLFLRRDMPGSVLHAGDIDNRIKTLIDALRMPLSVPELGSHTTPDPDEDPFFVLMEEDKLVSGFSVETDRLLDPAKSPDPEVDKRWAQVVITVNLRPAVALMSNLDFV